MIRFFQKINKKKKAVITIALVLFCVFLLGNEVLAAEGGVSAAIVIVVGWITFAVSYVLGYILTLIIDVLVQVAQYNDIIDVEAVQQGWKIVRDLCNMFFILILLIIAFATILRIESYNIKKTLPKLLIMAVLINFSRTISGLIIDFAQIIMMTFVNGFSQNGPGNFVQMFQINTYLSFGELGEQFKKTEDNNLLWQTLLGLVAGVVALIITTIVCIVLLATLVMRVVMLWVYVILSPLAFLLSAFPAGQKYASQWWSEFSKQVVVGPILAFFIWLALLTAGSSAQKLNIDVKGVGDKFGNRTGGVQAGTQLFESTNFQTYLITIALLIGGLIVTQQMGGAAGAAASRGMGWAKKGAYFGSGAFLGAKAARRVTAPVKQYMAMRKSARDEKVRIRTDRIVEGVDKVKQWTGGRVGRGARWMLGGYDQRALKERKEAKKDNDRAARLRSNFDNQAGEIDYAGGKWKYNASAEKWEGTVKGKTRQLNQDSMGKVVERKVGEIENRAAASNKRADRFEKRQKWADRGLAATGAVGVALAPFTGGLTALAAAPALLNRKAVRNWGKDDINSASSYQSREISKKRDELRLDSREELKAKMDDTTLDSFTRIAAILDGVKRGLFTLKEVESRRKQVEDLSRNNKRVKSQFEAELEGKGYIGVSKPFEELKDRDPEVREKGRQTITDNYRSGIHRMSDVDSTSLELSVPMAANSMKPKVFENQFNTLDVARQNAVIRGLKKADSSDINAKQALVRITNLNEAGMSDQEKAAFVKKLSYDDLNDIALKGKKKLKALQEFLDGNINKLSEDVQVRFDKAKGGSVESTKHVILSKPSSVKP